MPVSVHDFCRMFLDGRQHNLAKQSRSKGAMEKPDQATVQNSEQWEGCFAWVAVDSDMGLPVRFAIIWNEISVS